MRTLIVEDDFGSRKVAQKLMEEFGRAENAVDGREAMRAFVEAYAEKEPYDLILLDIMMPGMDGQEVLKKIRQWEEGQSIFGSDAVNILMMTALDDHVNIMEAFRSQCEGYIVKPIDRSKIVAQLVELDFINNGK